MSDTTATTKLILHTTDLSKITIPCVSIAVFSEEAKMTMILYTDMNTIVEPMLIRKNIDYEFPQTGLNPILKINSYDNIESFNIKTEIR